MWVNAMMTIWLWGTLFSFVLIGVSLWVWYLPHSYRQEENKAQKRNDEHGG